MTTEMLNSVGTGPRRPATSRATGDVTIAVSADLADEVFAQSPLTLSPYDDGMSRFIVMTDREKREYTMTAECHNCEQTGHFFRDCPKLGGSGKSVVGAKYGTAKGFHEGERPPQEYLDLRRRNRTRAAIAYRKRTGQATAQSNRGASTFAKERRDAAARQPAQHTYALNADELDDATPDDCALIAYIVDRYNVVLDAADDPRDYGATADSYQSGHGAAHGFSA